MEEGLHYFLSNPKARQVNLQETECAALTEGFLIANFIEWRKGFLNRWCVLYYYMSKCWNGQKS